MVKMGKGGGECGMSLIHLANEAQNWALFPSHLSALEEENMHY